MKIDSMRTRHCDQDRSVHTSERTDTCTNVCKVVMMIAAVAAEAAATATPAPCTWPDAHRPTCSRPTIPCAPLEKTPQSPPWPSFAGKFGQWVCTCSVGIHPGTYVIVQSAAILECSRPTLVQQQSTQHCDAMATPAAAHSTTSSS